MHSDHSTHGCITTFLRRLLRTANAEQGNEWDSINPSSIAAPGVVARLMGLDTMPMHAPASPRPTGRSRFMEGHPPGDSGTPPIKKSSSFREEPMFLSAESEDFFLLSFGREQYHDQDEEIKVAACLLELEEQSEEETSQGIRVKIAKRNGGKKKSTSVKKHEISSGDKTKTDNSESSSHNSSPVSVLDRPAQSKIDYYFVDITTCDSYNTNFCWSNAATFGLQELRRHNSRRRVRAELKITRNPTAKHHVQLRSDKGLFRSLGQGSRTRPKDTRALTYGDDICMLAYQNLKETKWAVLQLDEFCFKLEFEFFDVLLQEFLEELLLIYFPFSR